MPLILCNDYVGIVEDIGEDVKSVEIGQLVFGRISKKQIGTFWGIHFLVWMKIPCQIFYTKKRTFAVPSLYNQFTTKIMKEG